MQRKRTEGRRKEQMALAGLVRERFSEEETS